MRTKRLIAVCLFCFGIFTGFAQEVVSSGGDYFETTNGSISLTIGEVVTESYVSAETMLTQGMQQTTITVSEPPTALYEQMGIEVNVYPNPTSNTLRISCEQESTTQYSLSNLSGIEFAKGQFNEQTELPMEQYVPGVYLLTLIQNGQTQSIEVIKN